MPKEYDVFISYGRRDYELRYEKDGATVKEIIPGNPILQIVDALNKKGISCWYDQEGVSDGFLKYIKQKIDSSRVMIFVSSENSNASQYTPDEIARAKQLKMPIIPFKIDKTEFNEDFALGLASKNTIDIFMTNPKKALDELIKTVCRSLEVIYHEEEQKAIEQAQRMQLEELNHKIADLGRQEAEANVSRQEIRTLISGSDNRKLKNEYFQRLDDTGILYQEIKKKKKSVIKLRAYISVIIIVFSCLLAALGVAWGGMWFANKKTISDKDKDIIALKNSVDSIAALNESKAQTIVMLEQEIDSLQKVSIQNAAYLNIDKTKIEISSVGGTYSIPVKSNVKWKISNAPSNTFYTLNSSKNQVTILSRPNYTINQRSSAFDIETLDHEKSTHIQISQDGCKDTLITFQFSVVHNAEQKGLDIKCPFICNYLDGKLTVRAYFYKDGKRIFSDDKEKEYAEPASTGRPLVCSKKYELSCKKSGSDFSSSKLCTLFMPYSKLYRNKGKMSVKVIISHQGKALYTSEYLPFEY